MKYIKKAIPVDAWQIDTLEIDNQGNLYTAEVDTGKRAQKFMKVR